MGVRLACSSHADTSELCRATQNSRSSLPVPGLLALSVWQCNMRGEYAQGQQARPAERLELEDVRDTEKLAGNKQ